jgi:hypothetical protein
MSLGKKSFDIGADVPRNWFFSFVTFFWFSVFLMKNSIPNRKDQKSETQIPEAKITVG